MTVSVLTVVANFVRVTFMVRHCVATYHVRQVEVQVQFPFFVLFFYA